MRCPFWKIDFYFKGRWRHVTLPASDYGISMLKAGVGFDGSSVGFKKTHSSDMTLLIPDLTMGFIAPFLDVNCISPGTVDTPWVERLLAEKTDPEAARQRLNDRHPLGRLGTADEIAHAALYLASPESAFATRTNLVIDGGANAL